MVTEDTTLSEVLCKISGGWEGARQVRDEKYDKDRAGKEGSTPGEADLDALE